MHLSRHISNRILVSHIVFFAAHVVTFIISRFCPSRLVYSKALGCVSKTRRLASRSLSTNAISETTCSRTSLRSHYSFHLQGKGSSCKLSCHMHNILPSGRLRSQSLDGVEILVANFFPTLFSGRSPSTHYESVHMPVVLPCYRIHNITSFEFQVRSNVCQNRELIIESMVGVLRTSEQGIE